VTDRTATDRTATARTAFVDVLTDEELAVLAPPHALAVAPYFDELETAQQQTAKRTAYRGLQARGIVEVPGAEVIAAAGDDDVELVVRHDIRSVVTLREQAELLVAVSRTTSSTRDHWYAYVAGTVVLIEEISPDGLHRFALARDEQLVDLVVAASVHPNSGAAAGQAVAVPSGPDRAPPAPVLRQLGQALLRADLVIRHAGERYTGTLGVFSGPRGSWLVTGRGGATPVAHPMTADALREQLARFIEQIRTEAVTGADD
jgi:hypothetical protein